MLQTNYNDVILLTYHSVPPIVTALPYHSTQLNTLFGHIEAIAVYVKLKKHISLKLNE